MKYEARHTSADAVQYASISGNSAKRQTQNVIQVQFKSIPPEGQKLYYNNNCFIVYLKLRNSLLFVLKITLSLYLVRKHSLMGFMFAFIILLNQNKYCLVRGEERNSSISFKMDMEDVVFCWSHWNILSSCLSQRKTENYVTYGLSVTISQAMGRDINI